MSQVHLYIFNFSMSSFLKKLSNFLLLFILLWIVQVALVILIKGLMPKNIALSHKNKSLMEKRIFILGNSHVECAINDSLLPSKFVNLAKSGEPVFYSALKAQRIINSNVVDTIVMEFDNTSLTSIAWVLDDSRLLAHFKENFFSMNWEQFQFLLQNNPQKTIKSFLVLNLTSIFNSTNLEGGYLYLDKNRLSNPTAKKDANSYYPNVYSDSLQLKNFDALYNLIKANKRIPFIITRMPMHQFVSRPNDSSYFNLVAKLLALENVTYLDFHKKVIFPDSYFADSTHLNYKGANMFTPLFQKNIGVVHSTP